MTRQHRNKPITNPKTHGKMEEMRFSVAHDMGFLQLPAGQDWWTNLTPMQKSQVNGMVTKLLITKAQIDMSNGIQINK